MAQKIAPVWVHPSPHLTVLDAFRRHVNQRYHVFLPDYASLHGWTIENMELFYQELWNFSGLVTSKPPLKVANSLASMWPRPQWFPGAEMNFTENLLATGLAAHPDMIAVSACREGGKDWRHLNWKQLRELVASYTTAFRNAGVVKGDRVAAIVTNSLEALLIALAAGAVGAIFSSASPDMGPKAIVERFVQIQPKIMFIEPHVFYANKSRNLRDRLSGAVEELKAKVSCLDKVIVVNDPTWTQGGLIALEIFLDVPAQPLEFVQVMFDHPIYILFTSGTTGSPKCICHSGGAALLKNKLDLAMNMDMGIGSTYYQYTTTGWMMWNVLIGALSLGSRIILYDGSPLHPSPSHQLSLLESQGVTHWGTSPKFLGALKFDPASTQIARRLEGLQNVLVAGSPLATSLVDWFYADRFPSHIGLQNSSGGTDLVGAIVGGNNLSPVNGNELAAPVLGMKVEIWDLGGSVAEDSSNEQGELVITRPFVSMPIKFWGDDAKDSKYFDTYFALNHGVWSHGDSISRNPVTGGFSLHGRSDGVLNPGGIRFGTAELYDVISRFPEIEDSVAVGQRVKVESDREEERVVMFIKMRSPSAILDASLRSRITQGIRQTLSARHVPEEIWQVKDIPYSMNGKKMEKVVKGIICGEKITWGSIANPECLNEFAKFVPHKTNAARL
ncbi:hypothetical protein PFICI_02401 [Pestalotiopsis fici W106-1]|uniref:AMP-dependent synthetase/ligase domain-containing protein n=1 Tax=Pestalotiopsis fici (strain W106-1 / CGMCC3.15140) TaxID=1229662 RepID=W3XGN8_PESFW|nr:uncharacterized protein PFICI_02401 [Pestalotiopsis fici W106-1]ETS84376.1 hypothetical protein PFICI_02401 [Pestalotiopsis fici W106-1]